MPKHSTCLESDDQGLMTSGLDLLQADLKEEPKADETGRLWTPGAVDFFRIVNEQLQVTQTVSSGNLLLRSGQASLRVMRQFQVERHHY